MTDITALIAALTIVYLAERFRGIAVARWNPKKVEDAPPVQIPEAIMELASNYSDPWAKEDVIDRARELYGRLGNWNSVYIALKAE